MASESFTMPRRLLLIWEVLSRVGVRPERATRLMNDQGAFYTYCEAQEQLALAATRNNLRLIFPTAK